MTDTDVSRVPETTPHQRHVAKEHKLTVVVAVAGFLFLNILSCTMIYLALRIPGVFETAVRKHFLGVAGPPAAVMTGLIVVVFLRATAGPIEFEAPFGFKFRGASGQVVLWIFSFLACVAGMVAFWKAGE